MDGGASSPARCRASNFQFEPWQFRPQGETAESCGFCASGHPHHNLLEFSVGKLWPQIMQGSDFFSGKWDFPTQKSAPVSDARGDFADFPNRQNRSALADLKTLWVFNLLAGDRFLCERAAALSRSPGFGRFFGVGAFTLSRFADPAGNFPLQRRTGRQTTSSGWTRGESRASPAAFAREGCRAPSPP